MPLERDDNVPEKNEHLHAVIRLYSGKISVILTQKQDGAFMMPGVGVLAYEELQKYPPLGYKIYSHDIPPGQKSKFIVGPYLVTVYPSNAT